MRWWYGLWRTLCGDMRRRRKRIVINWKPVLTMLLIGNLFTGVFYSRMTSIVKVRVEGAQPDDQHRVRAILQRIHSQPALKLNRHVTESALLERSALVKAEMTRNIFGRARVQLAYRRPVARIAGMSGAALSRDGVIFQTSSDLSSLPIVRPPNEGLQPSLTVAGPWRPGEVAGLASELANFSDRQVVEISALNNGGLCLNIGSKFAVELGLPEQLDAKIDYLRNKVESDPALLVSGQTLNLVNLERPALRMGIERIK